LAVVCNNADDGHEGRPHMCLIDGIYLSEDEKRDCLRERARIDREVAEGRIVIADDEISAAQWERAERMLTSAGFEPERRIADRTFNKGGEFENFALF
jgi:hypothetical protein